MLLVKSSVFIYVALCFPFRKIRDKFILNKIKNIDQNPSNPKLFLSQYIINFLNLGTVCIGI